MPFAFLGAVSALIAVAAGAFGAHGLRGALSPDRLQVFETGVRYQVFHALALIAADLLRAARAPRPPGAFVAAGWLFAAGTVLFSGSLYALALTGVRAWGAVAPVGGLAFLAGWASLALGSARR